jgi:ribosomal subunit interface protein
MHTTITARHCEVSDQVRARALSVVERLGHLTSQAMEMTVVFNTEGPQRTVELRLHLAGGDILVAMGEAVDHRSGLDRAEEKLRRQVERASHRTRRSRPKLADRSL